MQRHDLNGRGGRAATVVLALLGLVAVAGGVQSASAHHAAPARLGVPTQAAGPAAKLGGEPIVVGSTLSLTGAFAATGIIHKAAGETFVRWINANGGLLGRRVEWRLLDDESDPAKVTALYERLISQDRVDLIMGPYATPNIVAAQAVAERHGYVLPNHTAVLTYALTYRCQFPTWSTGGKPNLTVPRTVFTALKTLRSPPRRIAFVTNTGGSTNFISYGAPNSSEGGAVEQARKAGLNVVLDLKYPPNVSDWGSLAAQVRAAQPDFVWNSGLATDPVSLIQAMEQLNYRPPLFFTLFPAPGPLLALGERADRVLSLTLFEPNGRLLRRMGTKAQRIVAQFAQRAAANGLNYRVFDSQATASWTAWEVLAAGVRGARGLDHGRICNYLRSNGAETTFVGKLKFNPALNNFSVARNLVKQIQNGRWVVVWPPASRVARLQGARPQ
jgi:branched-chain amino acid transport system substrate-binding protein